MKPIRDRQVFPQRLHVTICSMLISPFVFHVGPSVSEEMVAWKIVRRQFMRLVACVIRDGDLYFNWRGTFSKRLCTFSDVPHCTNGQWTILNTARSLIGDAIPSWKHVLTSEAVFYIWVNVLFNITIVKFLKSDVILKRNPYSTR